MLTKADVEARLKIAGAYWIANADDQHEIWLTHWGWSFWVPIAAPGATMYEEDLVEIEQEICASKPPTP